MIQKPCGWRLSRHRFWGLYKWNAYYERSIDFWLKEEEEEKDAESKVNDVPLEKSKLSEIAGAIELLEC